MNYKGQGVITFMFLLLTFIILYAMFFAKWLSYWGERTVINNNLVGFEAFFFSNLNILVIICLVIAGMGYLYVGANQ